MKKNIFLTISFLVMVVLSSGCTGQLDQKTASDYVLNKEGITQYGASTWNSDSNRSYYLFSVMDSDKYPGEIVVYNITYDGKNINYTLIDKYPSENGFNKSKYS